MEATEVMQSSIVIAEENMTHFQTNCQKFGVEIRWQSPFKSGTAVWIVGEIDNFIKLDEACPYMYATN